LLEDGLLEIGAIHTYIELYARLVVDLIPNVVLSPVSWPTAPATSTPAPAPKTPRR
jgi:hypothetical protein